MLRRIVEIARRLITQEHGQAVAEYALVIGVTMVVLVGVSAFVIDGLAAHYRDVSSVVCLPIP
jgi:Flp pilus assembly pilin Flp